jgi:hypothetical protein
MFLARNIFPRRMVALLFRTWWRHVPLRSWVPYLTVVVALGVLLSAVPASGVPASGGSTAWRVSDVTTTSVTSPISAGYFGFNSGPVSEIEARWNIPNVTCQSSLGKTQTVIPELLLEGPSPAGSKSSIVALALATLTYCTATGTKPSTQAFVVFLGSNNVTQSKNLTVKLKGGDEVSGSIVVTASTDSVVAQLENLHTSKTSSYTATVASASVVRDPYWAVNTAQVLGKFKKQPVSFLSCFYVAGGTTNPISALPTLYEVTMVDAKKHTMATVSGLTAGSAFTVTWKRST